MFKNLTIYRINPSWVPNANAFALALAAHPFQPCGAMEMESTGWSAPNDDLFLHIVDGQWLIQMTAEKKILPAGLINRIAKEKAAEMEQQQGFKPGRKQMREIKEQVTDELLPNALSARSSVRVWIDPKHGWLVIDTASPSRADHVLKMLLKSIDNLPIESLRTMSSPLAAMTDWLVADEAPGGFTIDRDAILRTTGECSRGTVKFNNLTLEAADIGRHIAAGKQCTHLAMTWVDRISFVLTEALTIKRIATLDTYKETGEEIQNDDERFDADFLMMTGALNKMLGALVDALGGEFKQQPENT